MLACSPVRDAVKNKVEELLSDGSSVLLEASEQGRCDVKGKILVADDEAHILHVVSMKLRNAGYEVVTAVDGEEALELCGTEKPDLIITDYQMPIMTGLEALKQIRQREEMRDIPAIMLTARGFDIEASEMIAAGIASVLAKPFSPREVLDKVTELLGVPNEGTQA
ncbi:MAG TPA: hypothetical protein DCX07_02740 [Phycisphaerales bacterium]|nr:hypothetical protein [Phycisphaerales bacterium]